eukprot:maker-scaffold79_size400133-snap-gene-2.16 protein:Tk03958 transcript:maker-scaffold79_size400133-snap-gene-2.16-mRNA-1 annotation:"hypothetical protein AZ18_3199"
MVLGLSGTLACSPSGLGQMEAGQMQVGQMEAGQMQVGQMEANQMEGASDKRIEKVNGRRDSLVRAIDIVDGHLQRLVGILPPKVASTRDAIFDEREIANIKRKTVATAISSGVFLQEAAGNLIDDEFTVADIFFRAGQSVSVASYASSRLHGLKETNLPCGLQDMHRILRKYEILLGLKETFDTYLVTSSLGEDLLANIPEESMPRALEFTASYFRLELKEALGCLLLEDPTLVISVENAVGSGRYVTAPMRKIPLKDPPVAKAPAKRKARDTRKATPAPPARASVGQRRINEAIAHARQAWEVESRAERQARDEDVEAEVALRVDQARAEMEARATSRPRPPSSHIHTRGNFN